MRDAVVQDVTKLFGDRIIFIIGYWFVVCLVVVYTVVGNRRSVSCRRV
jgi:hypothetical protein